MLQTIIALSWIPLVTALIGWFTNWVAIKMLFRPKKVYRFFGFSIQGLIPKRQDELGEKIGEIIEKELLDQHTLRSQFSKVDFDPYLKEFTHKLIHQNLGEKLRNIPLVGSMINESTLNTLENMASEALQQEVDPLKARIAEDLESHLKIKTVVSQKISALELDNLETLISRVAKNEFRAIELLGGFLGFVIGIAQVLILMFAQS